MLSQLAVPVSALAAYAIYRLLLFVYDEVTSPTRSLPGPKSTHLIYGNLQEIQKAENGAAHQAWAQQYGRTFRYFDCTTLTSDTKALNHFLTNSYIYQRPEPGRYSLGRIVGPGVLVTEEDQHKSQRRIMNPAFGAAQVRELTGIFVDKSLELRDAWSLQAANSGGIVRLDALSWLSRATLDIIGLAGFNYHFNALSQEDESSTELGAAFSTIFRVGLATSPLRILKMFFPVFRFIPSKIDTLIDSSQAKMMQIGRKLLQESKNEMADNGTFEKGRARDLLSLLVRANTSKDIPESQRLSDEDVLAQVPTFLVAGHETTSTGTTWALFALTQNVAAQSRLREELLAVETDNPTMDELNALPYLDCVVRETLRLHAPVVATSRVAMQDDVVPLNTPYTDARGTVQTTIRVRKGQIIYIPILVVNRDKEIWGADAEEFRPERWEDPEITNNNSIPGVWGHILSFLGGPRACIGYRFSLVEMKALLFTLIRAFEFELAVPAEDIGKKSVIVQRPIVRSEPKGGNQLPVIVRPYVKS
ncbi:cytochrome P450 [Roridomyces roridus]|uniref:Cytochrome P450 n=1 Tax=Roridomyces roridus TaxID=1738132 RepID=A0AAD7B615_9AGAR|nr:cytochrome P450 [Roridomyces roridus]